PFTAERKEQIRQRRAVAHGELARLRQLVAMHQEALAGARDDEPLSVPRRRGGVLAFFAVILVGGGVAALVLRPWERRAIPELPSVAAPPIAPSVAAPPIAPSVAAPPKVEPIVPKAEPIVPKAEPIIPKAAATIPKVEPVKAAHRAAPKHRASKSAAHKAHKRGGRSSRKLEPRGDDPLGGLGM